MLMRQQKAIGVIEIAIGRRLRATNDVKILILLPGHQARVVGGRMVDVCICERSLETSPFPTELEIRNRIIHRALTRNRGLDGSPSVRRVLRKWKILCRRAEWPHCE